jgi:LacI family transcriptional regulator
MATIKQIATDMGVSVATVSNALTGKGRVSAQMVARIKHRASELGYRPSLAGRALRSGQSGILGLVMPDLTNPLFPRIAQHLSLAADNRQVGVLIADSRGNPDEQTQAINRLLDRGVDGLLIVPQKGTTPGQQTVPTVIINTASDPDNTVSADHEGGGKLIAEHVTALGHRHLVILGMDRVSEVQRDRVAGMHKGLTNADTVHEFWGDNGIDQLARAINDGATAILTTSDMLALRVQSHLTRCGMSVPDDVSLTGFDDLPFAIAMYPMLTTVAQDVQQIANVAIKHLMRAIQGDEPQIKTAPIAMRLVTRNSTSTIRKTTSLETIK